MTNLTENERQVFKAWIGTNEEGNVLSFAAVARRVGVHQATVRRFVRAIARKGFLEFCRMSWNDDGPCGAGYMPTAAGLEALSLMQEPEHHD